MDQSRKARRARYRLDLAKKIKPNSLLHFLARVLPGGFIVRPWLHRWRGVKIGHEVYLGDDIYIDEDFSQDCRDSRWRNDVVGIEAEKRIQAIKNVTGNEMQFLGHFPDKAVMPGTLIVEAIGQAASILFAKMTGTGLKAGEFLVLGTINSMRFLVPVVPGDRMEIDVKLLKLVQDIALIEGVVTVDGTLVATGTLGFARRSL